MNKQVKSSNIKPVLKIKQATQITQLLLITEINNHKMKLVNGQKYAVIGLVAVLGIIIIALGWYVINWNNMHSQEDQISKFSEILPRDRVFYLPLLQEGSNPAQITNI